MSSFLLSFLSNVDSFLKQQQQHHYLITAISTKTNKHKQNDLYHEHLSAPAKPNKRTTCCLIPAELVRIYPSLSAGSVHRAPVLNQIKAQLEQALFSRNSISWLNTSLNIRLYNSKLTNTEQIVRYDRF